jgi:hypothetical protein
MSGLGRGLGAKPLRAGPEPSVRDRTAAVAVQEHPLPIAIAISALEGEGQ